MPTNVTRIGLCIALFVWQIGRAGAVTDPRAESIHEKLNAAYSALEQGDGAVELHWELFTPGALQPPPSNEPGIPELVLNDPSSGKKLFAQSRYRAEFGGGDRYRIEKNDTQKTLGAEKARWSVRVRNKEFNGDSGTLTAKRAFVTKARPYSPETDDLFDHEDAQCPNVVAQRLLVLLDSVAADKVKSDGSTLEIDAPNGKVSFTIDPGDGSLRRVRYRAKHSPKDFLIEYQGTLAEGIYPSPHPAFSRLYTLEPGEAPGPLSLVSRFDSVVRKEHANASRWSWTSIAPTAIDSGTNQVLRSDGVPDEKLTRSVQIQKNSEPARWEEPPEQGEKLGRAVEKSNPWQRWGVAFGATTIIIAAALFIRARFARS